MELKRARMKYHLQKMGAANRGIRWEFTFKTWLDWWGADIDRRGPHTGQLCMMRRGDCGPYAPWNVSKGTALQNARTRSAVTATKRTLRLAKLLEAERDTSPGTADTPDEWATEDDQWLHENVGWGSRRRSAFDLA